MQSQDSSEEWKVRPVHGAFYGVIIRAGKLLTQLQGLRMRVSGQENIPLDSGAVTVVNHTGYMDFVFGGYLPYLRGRQVRYMAKAEIFKAPVAGAMMRAMGHIPVDRIDGAASIRQAVTAARQGELVAVFSEGTISRSYEIRSMKTGAARIAHEAGVPVIPQVIFGSQRLWSKGQKRNLGFSRIPIFIEALEPYWTTGDAVADTAEIRRRMQEGLERLWAKYEQEFGPMPAGAPWVPSRMGGGAPTLEEVEAKDRAVESERHRVRRLRDDLASLKDKVADVSSALADSARERLRPAAGSTSAPEPNPAPAETVADAAGRTKPAETVAWLKENLSSVMEEASRGVGEGKERVAEIMGQLRTEIAEIQGRLASGSKEIYRDIYEGSRVEQALVSAATQARIIVSRLPQRVRADFAAVPRILIADESAFHHADGELSARAGDALAALAPELAELVVLSEAEVTPAFSGVPQRLWAVEHNGALVRRGEEVIAREALSAADRALIDAHLDGVSWTSAAAHGQPAAPELSDVLSARTSLSPAAVKDALGEELAGRLTLTAAAQGGTVITAAGANRPAGVRTVLEEVAGEPARGEDSAGAGDWGWGEALALLNHAGDAELAALPCVVLESAPTALLRAAKSVTTAADKEGAAEVLEMIAAERQARADRGGAD